MAVRVLLQRRSLAPLATLALGGLALAPSTIYAEAPPSFKRKPMYEDLDQPLAAPSPVTPPKAAIPFPVSGDAPAEPKPRGPSPTDRLAVHIGSTRLFLYRYAVGAEDAVNAAMDSVLDLEQSFTQTIASLGPSRESGERLMPGAIYVLVSAMAGSILTRNRNILLRSTIPLALGIGAAWTVLPVTSQNVADLIWEYEKRVPVVAESHIRLRESIQKGASFARVHGQIGAQFVDEKVTDAREAVEGWVKQGK